MSKVVCEICGTSYPETSTQCPICGCVKPMGASAVIDREAGDGGTYTCVKGGRFSKRNVKKRGVSISQFSEPVQPSKESINNDSRKRVIAVITSTVIALVVLAVVAYVAAIVADWYRDILSPNIEIAEENAQNSDSAQSADIPCISMRISSQTVVFKYAKEEFRLQVTCDPADTTDSISFISEDPEIVTVDRTGKLTAVSEGQTTITITCGTLEEVCRVSCIFDDDLVEIPVTQFELNREDFTLFYAGDNWQLYNGDIPVREITWTSDDEEVAIVEYGKVVAVGEGHTYIHAEYDGVRHSCIVHVRFRDDN